MTGPDPTSTPEDDLDQVERDIEIAEDDAERDLEGEDGEGGPRYVDSGDIRPDLDDQTITPG